MPFRIYWKVLGWSFLMLLIFLTPAHNLPEGPGIPMSDKFVHAVMFAVFSFMLINARMQHKGTQLIHFPLVVSAMIYSLTFGILIELAQSFMDLGREGDVLDLVSDLAGYFIGLLIIYIYKN